LHNPHVNDRKNALIRDWGFTQKEREDLIRKAGSVANASLIAFAIRSAQPHSDPLGIVYIEGFSANTFGKDDASTINDDGFSPADVKAETLWQEVAGTEAAKNLRSQLELLRQTLAWDTKIIEEKGR